jgi:hypothetical protein
MKRIILSIIFALSLTIAPAQAILRHITVELGEGFAYPLDNYRGGDNNISWATAFNADYHFYNSPWRCGIFLQADIAKRAYHQWEEDMKYKQKNITTGIGLEGVYAFRHGRDYQPYVGLGVGVGILETDGDKFFPTDGVTGVFIPKVGLEMEYNMRVNLYAQLSRKGYNTFGLTISWVIGGGSHQ